MKQINYYVTKTSENEVKHDINDRIYIDGFWEFFVFYGELKI